MKKMPEFDRMENRKRITRKSITCYYKGVADSKNKYSLSGGNYSKT